MEVKLLHKSLQVPERDLQQINIEAAFYLHLIQGRVTEITMLHVLVGEIYIVPLESTLIFLYFNVR